MTDRIRIATPQDHDVVHEIVQHAYSPWVELLGTRPAPMDAAYADLIADGAVHVTGAPIVVGVIVLVAERDALLIDNVAVAPARQGSGTGQRLLAFAEAEACRLGFDRVRLFTHEAMTSNLRLYQRLGYEITGRETIEKGHLVHLSKPVSPHHVP